MRTYDATSSVEAAALRQSGRKLMYAPAEKTGIVEVPNFPLLGKITALRFLEWVLKNPGGVISLPTGRTPEMFIRWAGRILAEWEKKDTRALLDEYGIGGARRPDMKSLVFVQMDEFYPMDASQHNSFNHYVREFYLKGFGLDPDRALLIDATSLGLPGGVTMEEMFPGGIVDLSLRVRQTKTERERRQKEAINRVDMFCAGYETRIREMGGIGFLLGGIGPDGHIAFNVEGSSFYSVTRLTGTNYETQAAAAADLGGIEISRSRLVITIGLATITANPSAAVIIMAAGNAREAVVRQAIEEKRHQQYPASALQGMEHARFYLTGGLANALSGRRLELFGRLPEVPAGLADEIATGAALALNKPLMELTKEDIAADPRGGVLLKKSGAAPQKIAGDAYRRIVAKIEKGLAPVSGTTFLHTEPHQDDIMLGYLAYVYHLVRDPTNRHCFANLTSGFTSVSNHYLLSIVRKLKKHLEGAPFQRLLNEGYFGGSNTMGRREDVYLFLDGSAGRSSEKKDEAEARRMMRNLMEICRTDDPRVIRLRVKELEEYLLTQYPGAKDPPDVQTLKGALREWEAELLWAHFGIEAKDIHALRLPFYRGDIFSGEPEIAHDVVPIAALLERVKPDIVTVAFDPEASGPDTHYKALQAVAEALKRYEKESGGAPVRVWGYRNVWYRFKPSEADIMVPVSLNTMAVLQTAFVNCFGSQSAASFPSYEHDGPFSELAQKILAEQYGMIKTCLGKDFFLKNQHPRLRAARGMIFLKEMQLPEFYEKVRELKKVTEAL